MKLKSLLSEANQLTSINPKHIKSVLNLGYYKRVFPQLYNLLDTYFGGDISELDLKRWMEEYSDYINDMNRDDRDYLETKLALEQCKFLLKEMKRLKIDALEL